MPFNIFNYATLTCVFIFSLAASALYIPIPRDMSTCDCTTEISWSPCPDNAQFDCASFPVPLDYSNPESGTATLAVARFKATNETKLGTIFTNPGGPGASGVEFLLSTAGVFINTLTYGQFDVISWDPRGVNGSTPQISCGFTTAESFAEFFGNSIGPVAGVEARGNFTDQDDIDSFFSMVNATDAKFVETGQKCLESDGDFLPFMGTTSVVRDLVSLADCFAGPNTTINYWGVSYGTVIGNYFVNMFPERVGRVILDGVVDTVVWATQPTFEIFGSSLSAIDSVLEGFAEQCVQAGPQNCSLAQNDSTPASVVQNIHSLIDTAYDLHKAGVSNTSSFDVREFIGGQLHNPTNWDAQLIPQLESFAATFANETAGSVFMNASLFIPRSGTLRRRQSPQNLNNTVDPTVQTFLSELVISCVDSIDQEDVTTQRVFEEVVNVTQNLSPTFGEIIFTTGQPFCHKFPARSVERFTGPFNTTLPNPIIVIGNRADPITPLAGAQRVASLLGDSARLVEQDGLGHSSLAENSDCTQGVIRDYFLQGALPSNGLICETDQALFPPNATLISPTPGPLSRREL
ncbi:alpha/beta-hydrolase [Ramaria rubella]|nr:alpha/beta-hydrolase [Ramaria rubella]